MQKHAHCRQEITNTVCLPASLNRQDVRRNTYTMPLAITASTRTKPVGIDSQYRKEQHEEVIARISTYEAFSDIPQTMNMYIAFCIGVARGCSGCTCTPRAVKKFFRRNLQGECVSAPPGHEVHPSQSNSQFLGQFVLRGLDLEVYL